MEVSGDSRRVWSAVKELLHGESGPSNGKADEDAAFSTTLATFFVNKVRNIKSAITAKIAACTPVPLLWDVPFHQDVMSTFRPVTASEVRRVLTKNAL